MFHLFEPVGKLWWDLFFHWCEVNRKWESPIISSEFVARVLAHATNYAGRHFLKLQLINSLPNHLLYYLIELNKRGAFFTAQESRGEHADPTFFESLSFWGQFCASIWGGRGVVRVSSMTKQDLLISCLFACIRWYSMIPIFRFLMALLRDCLLLLSGPVRKSISNPARALFTAFLQITSLLLSSSSFLLNLP